MHFVVDVSGLVCLNLCSMMKAFHTAISDAIKAESFFSNFQQEAHKLDEEIKTFIKGDKSDTTNIKKVSLNSSTFNFFDTIRVNTSKPHAKISSFHEETEAVTGMPFLEFYRRMPAKFAKKWPSENLFNFTTQNWIFWHLCRTFLCNAKKAITLYKLMSGNSFI